VASVKAEKKPTETVSETQRMGIRAGGLSTVVFLRLYSQSSWRGLEPLTEPSLGAVDPPSP